MHNEKLLITFTLLYKNEEYRVQTYVKHYYSLMVLISDQLGVNGFGLCCGMGSCGTCLVEICDKYSRGKRITLSCDVQVDEEIANTLIIIPEQAY